MHFKVLDKKAKALLRPLRDLVKSSSFVLAGGTGLALQYGHRMSDDFDFFSEDDFSCEDILRQISSLGDTQILLQDQYSLVVSTKGVKLSFFRYWDKFLFDPIPTKYFSLTDPKDIVFMKLVALSQRGARKDFIDLYFLFKKTISLKKSLPLLEKKFPNQKTNLHHILKSLVYFEDAEKEPMPKMLVPFDWEGIKRYFQNLFYQEFDV